MRHHFTYHRSEKNGFIFISIYCKFMFMLPVTIGKPYWRKSIFLQCLQTMYKSDHSQLVRSLVITQTSETASRPQAGVLKRLNLPA